MAGPASIGPARASDREAVMGICARLHPGGDYVRDAWDSWMREGSLRVARGPGGPVGVCGVSVRSGEAWLEGLRVDARLHGRGIGSALVADAASEARSRGAAVMREFVEAGNAASLRLAARSGFGASGAWTWYELSGRGGEPRAAAPRPLRGLRLDSWRAFSGGGEPLFLEGSACVLAPRRALCRHAAGHRHGSFGPVRAGRLPARRVGELAAAAHERVDIGHTRGKRPGRGPVPGFFQAGLPL